MTDQEILQSIEQDGYVIIKDVLSPDFVKQCKLELEEALRSDENKYPEWKRKDYGMVLLCSLHGGAFNKIFDFERLMKPFELILGKQCTVYAYTSSSMPPNGENYSSRIHVDSPRLIPNYVTNMGATIALDDFTEENGATYFLPRSHTRELPPSDKEFFDGAKRFIAPAGSVLFFNARLWHLGGQNNTSLWRHALTVNMCRPYMKQRIDIPRAMKNFNQNDLSQNCLQKLGFFSQPPTSIEEYYLPKEQRSFQQKQE